MWRHGMWCRLLLVGLALLVCAAESPAAPADGDAQIEPELKLRGSGQAAAEGQASETQQPVSSPGGTAELPLRPDAGGSNADGISSAGGAGESADVPTPALRGGQGAEEDIETMPLKKIREELKLRGVSTAGCVEKCHFVELLRSARASPAASPLETPGLRMPSESADKTGSGSAAGGAPPPLRAEDGDPTVGGHGRDATCPVDSRIPLTGEKQPKAGSMPLAVEKQPKAGTTRGKEEETGAEPLPDDAELSPLPPLVLRPMDTFEDDTGTIHVREDLEELAFNATELGEPSAQVERLLWGEGKLRFARAVARANLGGKFSRQVHQLGARGWEGPGSYRLHRGAR